MLAALACARGARADGGGELGACELAVRVEPAAAAWGSAVEELRAELAGRGDVDRCAAVRVEPAAEGAEVTVTSGGRAAVRIVETPADLRATVLALVVVPPPPVVAIRAPIELPALPRSLPPAPDLATDLAPDLATARAEPRAPTELRARAALPAAGAGIDLRMAGGAAWRGGRVGAALTAAASVERAGWIASATGRWEQGLGGGGDRPFDASLGDGPPLPLEGAVRSIGIGVEVGHAVRLGPVSLALTAGPAYAHVSQELHVGAVASARDGKSAPPRMPVQLRLEEDQRSASVLRLAGSLRATVRLSPRLSPYIELGACHDLGAAGDAPAPVDAVATIGSLPARSVGVLVGFQLWSRR